MMEQAKKVRQIVARKRVYAGLVEEAERLEEASSQALRAAEAAIAGHEETGDESYLEAAEELLDDSAKLSAEAAEYRRQASGLMGEAL